MEIFSYRRTVSTHAGVQDGNLTQVPLTFNLWCMQNLQTPAFTVEESLFKADRGMKPFFGCNDLYIRKY